MTSRRNITRRTFVRIGSVALGGTLTGATLAGCATLEHSAPAVPSEQASTPDASQGGSVAEDAAVQTSVAYDGLYPTHEPYGTGIGPLPGRVVWAHNPSSVQWGDSEYWWETSNFDEALVRNMVDKSVAELASTSTTREGWHVLFATHRKARGLEGGYTLGEKVAIKVNLNGSGVFDDDASGETQLSFTNPVLLSTLLTSLVEEAGVAAADITVYDVSRIIPMRLRDTCSQGILQGASFVDRNNAVPDETAPITWSHEFSDPSTTCQPA